MSLNNGSKKNNKTSKCDINSMTEKIQEIQKNNKKRAKQKQTGNKNKIKNSTDNLDNNTLKDKNLYDANYSDNKGTQKTNLFKSVNVYNNNYYYNYSNPILNNNLKKYTNNSVNFKNFNELYKPYHPYLIDKTKKLLLLSIKKERKKLFESPKNLPHISSSRNEYLNKESKTYKKENIHLFLGKKPTKPIILDNNKLKDFEIRDSVDFDYFKNDQYKRIIKKALLHDINFDTIHSNYLYIDYLKSKPHKINYFEDINIIPHLQNNLSLSKLRFKDINLLNKTLINRNYITKKVSLSLNRSFIIKSLLKKKKEIEEERIRKEDEYKLKTRWKSDEVYKEIKLSDYEKKFGQFELQDYFGKSMNYPLVSLVDKKIKENFFQKKF